MDVITAHLDRGWELLGKNDYRGADISARKVLEVDPESADAECLLGAILGAQGEDQDALEHFQRALELDPEHIAAMLYAAELLLGDEGDPEEALNLIGQALELAEEEEEVLDSWLLKAEALIQLERPAEAAATLAELPPIRLPDAGHHVRAAHLYLELGLLDEAEEHFRRAIALDADDADAHHGLGLVYEERDDHERMVASWLRVRDIELEEPSPSWGVSEAEFHKIADDAFAELPQRIRQLLENVPILVSDYPATEIISEGGDPRMMGFFTGLPYPEKSNIAGGVPRLDQVLLFQKNIERMSRSRDEVKHEIRITLIHETGHFFGLSDADLEAMGLG